VLLLLGLTGGGIGVWVHFTNMSWDDTNNALQALSVSALNTERIRPALIATAVVYLVFLVLLAIMSFARSFVEAAHDATGQTGAGSTVYLVFNVLIALPWQFITLWLVFILLGDCLWAGLVYTLRGSVRYTVDTYGDTAQPSWYPSSGQPCPGTCLDLQRYTFISSSLQNACVCDMTKLRNSLYYLDDAYNHLAPVLVGAFVMYVCAALLGVNLSCQYAHTSREKDYITRATHKQFVGF